MVFCRGCGKEIHETAPGCPHCGAPQFIPPVSSGARSTGKLIGLFFVWSAAFWLGGLVLTGFVVGAFDPENAREAGARVGQAVSGIYLLISLCLSAGLTIAGILPGTRKPS